MTLIYSLDQNDFLQHQLYIASKSARIKKKRRNSWLLVTIAFFVLGLVFYDMANKLMMYYFFGASLISFIFYPFYLKYHYKKHYQKFINDTYKNRTAEPSTICFKEQQVELFDKTAESKINFTEFEEIVETANYYYLRMQSGGSIIIAKLKVDNGKELHHFLKELANKLHINFTAELDWVWK